MNEKTPRLIKDADHWHGRADEARGLAEMLSDKDSKRLMLRIAEDYEQLALRAAIRAI